MSDGGAPNPPWIMLAETQASTARAGCGLRAAGNCSRAHSEGTWALLRHASRSDTFAPIDRIAPE